MEIEMRTTLIIPDTIYTRAKKMAEACHKTLSELTSEAIELQLLNFNRKSGPKTKTFKIKTFSMGVPKVDVADREALYRAMEE